MSTKFSVLLLIVGSVMFGASFDFNSSALLFGGIAAGCCGFFGAIS